MIDVSEEQKRLKTCNCVPKNALNEIKHIFDSIDHINDMNYIMGIVFSFNESQSITENLGNTENWEHFGKANALDYQNKKEEAKKELIMWKQTFKKDILDKLEENQCD